MGSVTVDTGCGCDGMVTTGSTGFAGWGSLFMSLSIVMLPNDKLRVSWSKVEGSSAVLTLVGCLYFLAALALAPAVVFVLLCCACLFSGCLLDACCTGCCRVNNCGCC